jgi:hypothetical protein
MSLASRMRSLGLAAGTAGTLNHAFRVRSYLLMTLADYSEACQAFLDNIRRQEALDNADVELFEEGGRLSVDVHRQIETFCVLARHLVEVLAPIAERAGLPAHALSTPTERDLHVRLELGPPWFTASVWAATGDAGMSPGGHGTWTLGQWMDDLEDYLEQVLDYLELETRPRA